MEDRGTSSHTIPVSFKSNFNHKEQSKADGVSFSTTLHPEKAHYFTMSTIIVHLSLKHVFKSSISLTYYIVLLPTVGKGRGCLLYHIVSWWVNRICLDFLLIVLTWRLESEPLTGAAQMERGAPLYQPHKNTGSCSGSCIPAVWLFRGHHIW